MAKNEDTVTYYWVYERGDGYRGLILSATERTVITMLNVLPDGFRILGHTENLQEARERLRSE